MAFIQDALERQQPFFLCSSFHDPQPPYVLSEPWASMYDLSNMEPERWPTKGEHTLNLSHLGKTPGKEP